MKEPTGSDVSNPLAVKAVRNARGGQPGAGSQGGRERASSGQEDGQEG